MMRWMMGVITLMLSAGAFAALVEKEIDYTADGVVMKGYLAFDDAVQGTRPGVLVVHEWWGHNAYARKRARMLADMGYTALAVDMYGDGKQADHPDDAGKFSGAVKKNLPLMKERFMAALNTLGRDKTVDAERLAAIGYCFGGAVVLEMARQGVDLDGVASFHGSLGSSQPAKSGAVKAKVLVANGADDPFVKPEQIAAFKQEMTSAGVDYRFINYPGAKHSFTNPDADAFGQRFNIPLAYSPDADKASWSELEAFLKSIFSR